MEELIRYWRINTVISLGSICLGLIGLAEGIGTGLVSTILMLSSGVVAYRSLIAVMILQQEAEEKTIKKECRGCNPTSTQSNDLVRVYHNSTNKGKSQFGKRVA